MKYVRGCLFGKNVKICDAVHPGCWHKCMPHSQCTSTNTVLRFFSVESFFPKNADSCNFGKPNLSIVSGLPYLGKSSPPAFAKAVADKQINESPYRQIPIHSPLIFLLFVYENNPYLPALRHILAFPVVCFPTFFPTRRGKKNRHHQTHDGG